MSPRLSFIALLASIAAALSGCGHMSEIASSWNNAPSTGVDATVKTWSGALWDLSDEKVSVGARNDQDYLYLCLMTTDRTRIFQVLSGGLDWWINSDGGKDKNFGIRFPIGGTSRGFLAALRGNQDNEAAGPLPTLDEARRDFEVLRNGSHQAVSTAEGQGVLAKVGYDEGKFICELRIPLESSPAHPYAVGAAPAGNITVGLETESVQPRTGGQPPRGEGGEGGGGGEGGMRGGGRGGMRGGGMRGGGGGYGRGGGGRSSGTTQGPLDTWLKLALARPPQSTPSSTP